MKLVYPAILKPFTDQSGGYVVEFPDLPGCVTEGKNLEQAIKMGIEAANGWISGELEDGKRIPPASNYSEITVARNCMISWLTLDIDKGFLHTKQSEKYDHTIIALIGESGSGKSSIQTSLVHDFGYKNIITYTTRDPREHEENGVDYNFISELQFMDLYEQGFFAETAVYNGWHYGSSKESYGIDSGINKVIILTPHGLRQIKKNDIDIFSVYIEIPRRDRLIKTLERGDNIEEAYRRSLSDVGQFDGIKDEVDLVIKNRGYMKSPHEISCEIIKENDIWLKKKHYYQ